MIKTVEHNDGESRLQGHVETLRQPDGTWTVTQYVEDKVYGVPWEFISEENVVTIAEKQLRGVAKVLSKMADDYKTKGGYEKLIDKGFGAL